MRTSLALGFTIALALIVCSSESLAQEHRHFNHDNDEIINGNVDPHKHIVCHGRVGRLIIRGKVDGGSILDLRELQVREVIIKEKVDGASKVLIRNTEKFEILEEKIDGESEVIAEHCPVFIVKEKIDGGSKTMVTVNGNQHFHPGKDGIRGGAKVTVNGVRLPSQ